MHPADIQAELKKRGITQKAIALEMGISEYHVSAVISRRHQSDRVMRIISEKIGLDHREVFPEYYFRKNPRKRATA